MPSFVFCTIEDVLLTPGKKDLLPYFHVPIFGLHLETLAPSGLSLRVYPTRSYLCTCCQRNPKMGAQVHCSSRREGQRKCSPMTEALGVGHAHHLD